MFHFQILKPGAAERRKLDAVQGKIAETRRMIEEINLSDLPAEDVRDRLLDALRRSIETYPPDVQFDCFFDQDPRPGVLPDTIRLVDLAWLLGPETVADALAKRLTQARGREPGPPLAARPGKLAQLRAQLEKLEIDEELATLDLEAAGHTVFRREDASPEILFRVWGADPEGDEE